MMKDPVAEEKRKPRPHQIMMEDRRKATLTGVIDVASFHDQEVILRTDDGEITIVGEQLHISQLSLEEGRLIVEGMIGGLEYTDAPLGKQAGLFSRIFR